ncbi:acyltransferase [Pseudomonas sp. S 311-6]|uniref:acyltransferase family protein n=1 Tax=Pseudomonas TaxID=286 RepID=UPI0020969CD0|nr:MULTISPECIES: acyltransferase family protein [Pseudomonas]MCO7563577.1 acyltransferase [Pseudomonas mosselii]MCO7616228.1 acyltransferase [Pseudomonas guariconensis]MCO7635233.1 acyltransferase [Pseudomonas sp. S 311-6]
MSNPNVKYRPEIDGLRAIAVLSVILFHAGFSSFSGGFVGVDIFFVISGFLITTILIGDQEKGGISIKKFYQRRAKRIMPALFVVIFATLPAAWLFLPPPELKSYFASIAATATFSSNILFWYESGYWDTATSLKPLIHTWSLAVEEQYYIIFPMLVMAAWRLGRSWFALIVLAISVASIWFAEHYLKIDQMVSFYMLPSRAWELLAGSLTALYLIRRSAPIHSGLANQALSLSGLSMIIYAIFSYTEKTPFPGINAAWPVLGSALLIATAGPRTLVGMVLGSRPFVMIGLISYSAYLWHQPIIAMMKLRGFGEITSMGSAIAISLTICLSYLSYRFIEKPVREGNSVFGRKPLAATSMAAISFIAIAGYGYSKDGFPSRIDSVYSADARSVENAFRKKYILDTAPGIDLPVILIIGDSYLYNWSIGLNEIIDKSKYRVISISYLGCKVDLSGETITASSLGTTYDAGCKNFSKILSDKDTLHKIEKIFLTTYKPFEYAKNLQRFDLVDRIVFESGNASLYVFGNYYHISDRLDTTCLIAMFTSRSDARKCIEISEPEKKKDQAPFFSKFKSTFTYVDFKKMVCGPSGSECPYSYMGVPFMLDRNHITATFAAKSMEKAVNDNIEYLYKIGLAEIIKTGS